MENKCNCSLNFELINEIKLKIIENTVHITNIRKQLDSVDAKISKIEEKYNDVLTYKTFAFIITVITIVITIIFFVLKNKIV